MSSAVVVIAPPVQAASYRDSAHGSAVDRPAMSGYAIGNCAHCHEMHASLAGVEPEPSGGSPHPYTVFADNFTSGATAGSYLVTDNFCFYCHGEGFEVVQAVANADYSTTFGGGSLGTLPQSILAAFNQTSYHNLGDIQTFMTTGDGAAMSSWYTSSSNPCNACHNPHLAKKNFGSSSVFSAPLASAISKPGDHFNLWGGSETMAAYSGYEPPYADRTSEAREPDGTVVAAGGDGSGQAAKTPDYIGFCTDCHNTTNTIESSTLPPTLRPIDWSSSGDKHGGLSRDVGIDIREPFASAQAGTTNFVLSCLDCHEPHGASNIMLLRSRVNGEDMGLREVSTTNDMGALCQRCHKDDAAAGYGSADQWRYIHHESSDAPYPGPPNFCKGCHNTTAGYATPVAGASQPRIHCGQCHFHNSDDSWMLGVRSEEYTGRTTF